MVNLGREGLLHGREERWVTEYGMRSLLFWWWDSPGGRDL